MRSRVQSSSLNLPILLSFNELAWIAVFAMGLACAYTWKIINTKVDPDDYSQVTNRLAESQAMRAGLTNDLGKLKQRTNSLGELLVAQQGNLISLSNLCQAVNENLRQTKEKLTGILIRTDVLSKDLAEAELEKYRLTQELMRRDLTIEDISRKLSAFGVSLSNLQVHLASQSSVPQEILNLKGGLVSNSMHNVVFLLDRSGSMAKGGRWHDALGVVDTWLKNLPIKRAALVTFSDDCQRFPESGQWAEIGGPNGISIRSNLVEQLKGLQPLGYTDTLRALQVAYSYTNGPSVDSIILFTDGKPELRKPGGSHPQVQESGDGSLTRDSEALMQAIHKLCRSKKGIPVNTVAIGNYFDKRLADFLIQLSEETGGTFLGR